LIILNSKLQTALQELCTRNERDELICKSYEKMLFSGKEGKEIEKLQIKNPIVFNKERPASIPM